MDFPTKIIFVFLPIGTTCFIHHNLMDAYWNYNQCDMLGKCFLLYPAVNIVIWNKFGEQINILLDCRKVYKYFQADKLLYTHC